MAVELYRLEMEQHWYKVVEVQTGTVVCYCRDLSSGAEAVRLFTAAGLFKLGVAVLHNIGESGKVEVPDPGPLPEGK